MVNDMQPPTVDARGAAYPPSDLPRQPLGRLPSVEQEARAFWRMRRRIMFTLFHQALRQSRFRLSLIVVLTAMLWGSLFWFFVDAFRFLESTITHPATLERLLQATFGMFFSALMVMLTFSSGILLFSALFRGDDLRLLLTLPVRQGRVFLHKFQDAIFFSSWGFLLLGTPILLAYGIVAEAPWYYYLMVLPFLVAFTYIPTSVGALACLAVARWTPRRQLLWLVLSGAGIIAAAAWIVWSVVAAPSENMLTADWFDQILGRLRFVEQRLFPSWWLSAGLLEAAGGHLAQSFLFLALMISNALFLRQIAVWLAERGYRTAYSSLSEKSSSRGRATAGWIDQALIQPVPLSANMRLLLVKDLRLFRRDPVQWSQVLIFLGLLLLYIVNIRRFNYNFHHVGWANMISFLNLSVVGLILATFTTRFIFPLVSLEARRFWILGLLPIRRETILWSKFLFAAGGSVIPCCTLVFLSDLMLRVEPAVLAIHQAICVLLCVGLSGIAVGLGARLPNFRETSPARIAAGFGGTLNLVLSAVYILIMVMLTALPCHFYIVAADTPLGNLVETQNLQWWLELWIFLGTFAAVLLGIAATTIPMLMGFRAFRNTEF